MFHFSDDPTVNLAIFNVILLGIMLVMWSVFGILYGLSKCFEREERGARKERLKEIESRLRACGVLFRTAVDSNILGICLESDFQKSLAEYNAEGRGAMSPTSKVSLDVPATYTFAIAEEHLRPAHTGTKDELLEQIIYPIVRQLSGDDLEGLNPKELEYLGGIIARMDRRLFVPFAGLPEKDKATFERIGRTDISVAKAALMK